jgi:hypothetical protein
VKCSIACLFLVSSKHKTSEGIIKIKHFRDTDSRSDSVPFVSCERRRAPSYNSAQRAHALSLQSNSSGVGADCPRVCKVNWPCQTANREGIDSARTFHAQHRNCIQGRQPLALGSARNRRCQSRRQGLCMRTTQCASVYANIHSLQACMQTYTDCKRVCKHTQFASVHANIHSLQACMQTYTACMRVCKRTQFASVYANIHSLHTQHRNCVQGRQPLSLEGARMGASTHIAIRPKTIQPIDTPNFVERSVRIVFFRLFRADFLWASLGPGSDTPTPDLLAAGASRRTALPPSQRRRSARVTPKRTRACRPPNFAAQ